MKLIELKADQEFIAQGYVMCYSIVEGKMVFKRLRKHDGKSATAKAKSQDPPKELDVRKYAIDNGYDPDFMWEKMRGYIDAGMEDSHGNAIRNWKLKLNQIWFVPANKLKTVITKGFFQE